MSESSKTNPIAYLTSIYPAASHTFILREIEGVRAVGLDVRPFSVRQPPESHLIGKPERRALAETFYVLKAAKNPLNLFKAQDMAFTDPGRYFRTLKLAWTSSAPGVRARTRQFIYFAEATLLAYEFKRQNITHLHNHFADISANVAMLAAELANISFSYTLHGPAELYEPQKWALAEKTKRAKFVACISHFARSQAMYFSNPVHWKKLSIIHCGIRPEMYDRCPSSRDEEQVRLLFVGRLTAIKGLRVLLEAFTKARVENPKLHLTLVGDGDDRTHLETLAKHLGDAIHFAGYQSQDNVAQALADTDIFVLPSFAEGVPVVLMEAMASSKPTITSLVAGIPELVEDGVTGYLVPPGDAETMASKILRLAGDPDLRHVMGEKGREKVVRDFNIDTESARIAALHLGEGIGQLRPAPLSLEKASYITESAPE